MNAIDSVAITVLLRSIILGDKMFSLDFNTNICIWQATVNG